MTDRDDYTEDRNRFVNNKDNNNNNMFVPNTMTKTNTVLTSTEKTYYMTNEFWMPLPPTGDAFRVVVEGFSEPMEGNQFGVVRVVGPDVRHVIPVSELKRLGVPTQTALKLQDVVVHRINSDPENNLVYIEKVWNETEEDKKYIEYCKRLGRSFKSEVVKRPKQSPVFAELPRLYFGDEDLDGFNPFGE